MRLDNFDEAPIVLVVLKSTLQQSLGVAADGGKWRAQLVRDVGHKILAHPLQALKLGDVVQDRDGAPAGGRGKGAASTSNARPGAAESSTRSLLRLAALEYRPSRSMRPGSRTRSTSGTRSATGAGAATARANESLQNVTRKSPSTANTPSTMLARIASRRDDSRLNCSTRSRS